MRFRSWKGTLMVKVLVRSPERKKLKLRYVGEVMILLYCGSSTFQRYKPYLELYVTGNSYAIALQVLSGGRAVVKTI